MRTCCKWRFEYIGLGKNNQVNHWKNAARSRWDFNFDLNVKRVVTPEMAGGRHVGKTLDPLPADTQTAFWRVFQIIVQTQDP